MARIRVRCRNYSVGQINKLVKEAYEAKFGATRLHIAAESIIEKEILNREVTCQNDIKIAEAYVTKVGYENIGDFIEEYMRRAVMDDFPICQNSPDFDKNKYWGKLSPFDDIEYIKRTNAEE